MLSVFNIHLTENTSMLTLQLNRIEGELATFTSLLEKNEEEYDLMKQHYALQHKVLQQSELNASRLKKTLQLTSAVSD